MSPLPAVRAAPAPAESALPDPAQRLSAGELSSQAELRRMMLDVADIVDVELEPVELPPREAAVTEKNILRFGPHHLINLRSAMRKIRHAGGFPVRVLRRAVHELLVVLKKVRIGLVERLFAHSLVAPPEVDIGEEERVEHDLVHRTVRMGRNPGVVAARGDALLERCERRPVLPPQRAGNGRCHAGLAHEDERTPWGARR